MIDGKVLIELPPRQLDVISCVFSSKEQAFYNDLAAKMESTLENLMATEGKKNYISVLLLLLRLRQGNIWLAFALDLAHSNISQHATIAYWYRKTSQTLARPSNRKRQIRTPMAKKREMVMTSLRPLAS